MYYTRAVILLTLAYLALTSNLEPLNIVVGLLVSVIVVALIRPQPHALQWRQLPGTLIALLRYVVILAYDLIVSGLQVARIVLDPKMPIKPGILAIPAKTESEIAQALNAHAITLTPGEIVVEMAEDGTMYTHCLDAAESEKLVSEAQELRTELLEKILL